MSRRFSPDPARRFKWLPVLAFGVAGLLVLGVIAVAAGKLWIESYLHGEAFRSFVSAKASQTLHAQSQFAAFHLSGSNFFCEEFRAQGSEQSAFAQLEVEQVRTELSLRRFFERTWQVDQLVIEKLSADLDGPRTELVSEPKLPAAVSHSEQGWLPNRVTIDRALINDVNLTWGNGPLAGSLKGSRVRATPRDQGAWSILAQDGLLRFPGLPEFEMRNGQVLYRGPSLFVQSVQLELAPNAEAGAATISAPGMVRISGELVPHQLVDLRLDLLNLQVTPFLPEDWRLRLHGNLTGDLQIEGKLTAGAQPPVSGKLQLISGQLEALPILDKIAAFTQLQQFRRLALSKASAEFRREGGTLRVKNLVAESQGLIRIEGGYTLIGEKLEGTFQVGVTPASLQWLPGSQEKVFTESRAGYLWSAMHLGGSLQNPTEDLSARLAAAAQGAVIEKVQGTVERTLKTGTEAAKGLLDLFLK